MRHFQQSSGDLVADRRAGWANGLAGERDFAAAAELMAQALELAPGWTAGWCLYGDYLRDAGNRQAAADAYRKLAQLDAAGIFGAGLKLAALGVEPIPEAGAAPYVEALFDDYAERFESELIDGLCYAAPQKLAGLIMAEMDRRGMASAASTLDLGCGTGLMGVAMGRRAGRLTGVDLSAAMLEQAARKGCYAELIQADLLDFLRDAGTPYSLLTAADVLNYVGGLAPVLRAARNVLAPEGLLAFTLERHSGPEPMVLRESLRYAHSPAAVQAALGDAGFAHVQMVDTVLRRDRGAPVDGVLVLAG